MGADYPEFEIGPDFEYRLRIVQLNDISVTTYNYYDLMDTTFVFYQLIINKFKYKLCMDIIYVSARSDNCVRWTKWCFFYN